MLAPCHPSSLSAPPPPTLTHTQHMWLNEIQTKGKTEKRKDLPGCLCLCMGVCVSVGTCVCVCGVSRQERSPWLLGGRMNVGMEMERNPQDEPIHPLSGGGGEGEAWIPTPETSPSSPPTFPAQHPLPLLGKPPVPPPLWFSLLASDSLI